MDLKHAALVLGALVMATAQSPSQAIITNLDSANWTHEKGAAPDSEGAVLRTDPTTGGMDLLVRFPGGHVIAPHWHESNERVFVAEGQTHPAPGCR